MTKQIFFIIKNFFFPISDKLIFYGTIFNISDRTYLTFQKIDIFYCKIKYLKRCLYDLKVYKLRLLNIKQILEIQIVLCTVNFLMDLIDIVKLSLFKVIFFYKKVNLPFYNIFS